MHVLAALAQRKSLWYVNRRIDLGLGIRTLKIILKEKVCRVWARFVWLRLA
jgi:hypothetical protein